jgi:hypothetical protein
MPKSKARPAIYADIEALPANMVGEIIFGVLHAHPRPAPRHAVAANAVGSEVSSPFQFGRGGGPGGWIFMVEPELHLGPHVIVPDLAGWKRDRLTPFPETAYIETPPDWLCEVLSPSTQAIDRTDKLTVYGEFGVKHCWYVDPIARTLEVLALTTALAPAPEPSTKSTAKWRIEATFKDGDAVSAPPFEVYTFGLDGVWVG